MGVVFLELGARKREILRASIESYVQAAEPVSSRALMDRLSLKVSSATIRNEMSELEELGLLEQPHTSAGRIPTALGYRLYVNELMRRGEEAKQEEDALAVFEPKADNFEEIVAEATRFASNLTALPSYALQMAKGEISALRFECIYVDAYHFILVILLSNKSVKNKLIPFPAGITTERLTKIAALFNANFTGKGEREIGHELILATERVLGDALGLTAAIAGFLLEVLMRAKTSHMVVSGANQLLGQPEFQDVEKARRVLNYLSDEEGLMRLPTPEGAGVQILIGPENVAKELSDSSVVIAKYDVGDGLEGLIGVVGPTRMDYAKVAGRLSYIAGGIARVLALGIPLDPEEIRGGTEDE